MFTSLLSEALAVAADNLSMTATLLDCTTEAAQELSLEARQRLTVVQLGLSMAIQALDHEELQQIMQLSDAYVPAGLL